MLDFFNKKLSSQNTKKILWAFLNVKGGRERALPFVWFAVVREEELIT